MNPDAPVVSNELLEKVAEVSGILRKRGEKFNRVLIKGQRKVAQEMEEAPPVDDGVPFEVCLALTTSWLVASGFETHADKVLRVIRGKDLTEIDDLLHPRGHAVRLSLKAWMPLINEWEDNYFPTPDELFNYYEENIHDSAVWCRWGVLAPVKAYAVFQGWERRDVNKFIPPMGKYVRAALKHLFGLDISNTENTSGYHTAFRVQLHLARLARTSVIVINSGLWDLGLEILSEE